MAAPLEKVLKDLNGHWQISHKLSDSLDAGLKIQGFSWLLRKTFLNAPLYLQVEQYNDEEGKNHLKTKQTTLGGAPVSADDIRLDFSVREKSDPGLGQLKGKCGWRKLEGIDDADFLTGCWLDEDEEHIELFVESLDHGWTNHQVFGFEKVNGERHFCVRVVLKKEQQVEKARLVYDYVRPLDPAT